MKFKTTWDAKSKKFKTYTISRSGMVMGDGKPVPPDVQLEAMRVRRASSAAEQQKNLPRKMHPPKLRSPFPK
jgi:hypothetical protein